MSWFSPAKPKKRPPDPVVAAVRDYELRLVELLVSCADHQRHDPEVFLWNARRSLEAICHLLLTVHQQEPSRAAKNRDEASLDGMVTRLKKAGVLDREQAPRFDLARTHTNLGVHIQQPEREDYAAPVSDTAHVLPGILDWLYDESIAQSYLKLRTKMPIDLIREGGREGPSLKHAAVLAEVVQRDHESTTQALLHKIEAQRTALANRQTRWWQWAWRVVVGAAVGFLVGAGLGFGIAVGAWDIDDMGPATRLAMQTMGGSPPAGVRPTTDPPRTDEAESSALVEERCPDGMVYVGPQSSLQLAQPVGGRRNWPRPLGGELPPVAVGAFCIDAFVRSGSSVPAASAAGCEGAASGESEPAVCFTRDEAEAVCAATVDGGRLPSLAEWESAVRASPAGLTRPGHEWVGERFPPRVLGRSDASWEGGDGMWVGELPEGGGSGASALQLAWNQQEPDRRHPERAFRCVTSR